jgi:hypothetical protein
MGRLVASEWLKLRTLRSTWVIIALAVVGPVLLGALFAANTDDMTGSELFQMTAAVSIIAFILLGVLGAISITAEFGHNTIKPTFAATPRRLRVVTAKALVIAGSSATVQVVAGAIAIGTATAIAQGRGSTISFGGIDNLVPAAAGLVLFAALLGLLGLGFGLLLKSTPGAVALLILWPFMIESVLGGILGAAIDERIPQWAPFTAGSTLFDLNPSGDPVGRLSGGLVLVGFVTALLITGSLLTARRDT